MSDVAKEIIQAITNMRDPDMGTLKLSDPLDKLGLDSLQVVELAFIIEEKFNVDVPLNANLDIGGQTLADLIHTVEELVGKKASAT
jgi:acyl carrier protein